MTPDRNTNKALFAGSEADVKRQIADIDARIAQIVTQIKTLNGQMVAAKHQVEISARNVDKNKVMLFQLSTFDLRVVRLIFSLAGSRNIIGNLRLRFANKNNSSSNCERKRTRKLLRISELLRRSSRFVGS